MSMPFLETLARHARERPDAPALAFLSRGEPELELSWSALALLVGRLGRWLRERGVADGEVVLVLSPAPRDQILGFLGALAAGGVPSIVSFPSVKQNEERFFAMLASVVRNSRARWLLGTPELAGPAAAHPAMCEHGVATIELPDLASLVGEPLPFTPASRGPLFLQFSSGTTGARKGIAVTEEMLAAQAWSCGEALGLGPDDRIVSWLPLYHDNGLVGCFLLPMVRGAFSAHLQPFEWVEEPASLFRAAARYRATLLWSPNFAFGFCARRIPPAELAGLRFDDLRAFISCGELAREATCREFLDRFGPIGIEERHLQVCYGMAENTFAATQTELGRPVRRDVIDRKEFLSCGRPISGHEVRIAGGVEERRVGEIEIRSACLFAGYQAVDPLPDEVFTPDGWYRSGDLGYLADGELFVTGRAGEMIIHRGVNLHPEDLQEAAGAVPGVKDGRAVVFGVFDASEGTEQIVALVEPDGPRVEGNAEGDLARRVRDAVSATFGLELWDVRVVAPGALLKSTSGKVSRKGNRKAYLEGRDHRTDRTDPSDLRSRSALVAPRDPWETELVEIWQRVLERRPIGVTDDLFLELGAGSLTALSAVGEIRARLGRELEPHHLLAESTIEAQAALLRDAATGAGTLVALRTISSVVDGAPRRPFYLIHAAGGSPFSYLALARRLGPDQPVYAFRDPHLSQDRGGFATVEEMTEAYLAELEATDPEGPYALGGWSFGGLVAFEMASRLVARGREVSLLLMLDTFPPDGPLRQAFFHTGRVLGRALLHTLGAGRIFSLLYGGRPLSPGEKFLRIAYFDPDGRDPRVVQASFPDLFAPGELQRLAPEDLWQHVYERLREKNLVRNIPGRTAAGLRREQRMFRVHHELTGRYRPRRTYPGTITFFTARGSRTPLAWRCYTSRPLNVHELDIQPVAGLPDAHLAFMQDNNVALYAETLREILRGAETLENVAPGSPH